MSWTLPRRMIRNGWSPWHFIGAGVMVMFAVWMTYPAWRDIFTLASATSGKARYVFLVPVVAAWLVWVRRRRILHIRPSGHWLGLLMIFAGGLCFSIASHNEAQAAIEDRVLSPAWVMLWHAGAVTITTGCALTLLGAGVIRRFLPAILVLVFLVPLPEQIAYKIEAPVQVVTLELTATIYEAVGIDATVDYDVPTAAQPPRLVVNDQTPPAEVYHGLPMVFDLFLVSWAFVFGSPLRGSVRLIILLLSPVSAILCGAAGLVATMWLYGLPGMLERADFLHQIAAWVMLLVAFLLLTGVVRALSWASVPVRHYTLSYDM